MSKAPLQDRLKFLYCLHCDQLLAAGEERAEKGAKAATGRSAVEGEEGTGKSLSGNSEPETGTLQHHGGTRGVKVAHGGMRGVKVAYGGMRGVKVAQCMYILILFVWFILYCYTCSLTS